VVAGLVIGQIPYQMHTDLSFVSSSVRVWGARRSQSLLQARLLQHQYQPPAKERHQCYTRLQPGPSEN